MYYDYTVLYMSIMYCTVLYYDYTILSGSFSARSPWNVNAFMVSKQLVAVGLEAPGMLENFKTCVCSFSGRVAGASPSDLDLLQIICKYNSVYVQVFM